MLSEREEDRRYIKVLSQNFDKEKGRREAIDDEFSSFKEAIKRLNENVKELVKIWSNTKLSMEKLFLIAEVCS